ncbi:ArnT family glycosyltransferase [Candidatus Solirubrobacter pratensis]|uniref:ArnT family glycosyltransferase n=1 Tax=Candidatus Solirubrobacter pratensis TaxID=1298857 RepID=UPI00041165C4|nr:glycosyltransferase family 39 protein [Candidatus Solirubrobacter pratensis]
MALAEDTAPAAAPAAARDRLRHAPAAALALILLVSAGLRLWGIRQGLPYAYNLDERAHFVPHAVAMTSGDLNPGYFINPPAFTYMIAAWLSVLHLGGDVQQLFADDPARVFLDARVLTLLLSVGAVAATYAAGRAFFGRGAGLLAAAVLALAFLPVFYSRQALNDGPAVLPCALGLWAAAAILHGGGRKAYAAAGACVGFAASMKYSDGVIVIAPVVAALVAPGRDLRRILTGLAVAAGAAIAVVIVTNPYMFTDWATFTNDLDRQRKFASGDALLGQPERNGWVYYARSIGWALGVVPALAAVAGGAILLLRRRREAWIFGALVILFWLYMGSQHRFYARWMLPLYPALAILAGYAAMQLRRVPLIALASIVLLVPMAIPTIRNAAVMSREDTRTQTRDWLVAHVPAGTKVVFEPIAPTEWYGVTPGGGTKADPARQWQRYNRSQAEIAELAKSYRGARRTANFQNYERTLTPKLIDVYRRDGFCWVVSGSTQYGRADAEPQRAPEALKYYRALKRQADVVFTASPLREGRSLPRYQVDRSFNFADPAYERPGPVMKVYRLRNCGA